MDLRRRGFDLWYGMIWWNCEVGGEMGEVTTGCAVDGDGGGDGDVVRDGVGMDELFRGSQERGWMVAKSISVGSCVGRIRLSHLSSLRKREWERRGKNEDLRGRRREIEIRYAGVMDDCLTYGMRCHNMLYYWKEKCPVC